MLNPETREEIIKLLLVIRPDYKREHLEQCTDITLIIMAKKNGINV